jgi:hypothetical protein
MHIRCIFGTQSNSKNVKRHQKINNMYCLKIEKFGFNIFDWIKHKKGNSDGDE